MSTESLKLPRLGPDRAITVCSVRTDMLPYSTDKDLDEKLTELLADGYTIELIHYVPPQQKSATTGNRAFEKWPGCYRIFASRPDVEKPSGNPQD